MTTFFVPAGEGMGEYTEKRSRFIGQIFPVETETDALARIAAVRKENYDARHVCFAYLLRDSGITRYGDDGEPQGTAGQPILAVLNGAKLENVCCTVTRYFGGVLLGTGGLVRAYTAAAKAASEDAGTTEMASWQTFRLVCPYGRYERIRRVLEEHEAIIDGTDFGADVTLSALVREDRAEAFAEVLREVTAGGIVAENTGIRFCGVRIR